jgi:signal transduction histidine kinase
MRSLVAPLVAGLVLSLALVFGVQWTLFTNLVDDMIVDYVADELAQDSEELYGSLTFLSSGETALALTHFDPPFLETGSGRYYQILLADRPVLRSPSLGDQELSMTRVPPDRNRTDLVPGPTGQELVLESTGYTVKGHSVTIGVAADVRPIRSQFALLMSRYAEVTIVMFALLVAMQVAIVRLSLGVLQRVRAELVRLERGEIAQLGERVPLEVLPLVREINRLVELLLQRLQRSRDALGNLAHALKTPLAVLKHMADEPGFLADQNKAGEMAQQVDLLRSRVDLELRRARVAGGSVSGVPVDVPAEIDGLIGTLDKLYRERRLEFERDVDPDCRFAGDREDLVELCGNLLDNACKWARARVRISAHAAPGLVLVVEDDGPGCPPELLNKIGQRGLRVDEAKEGHGLGLAIVDDIAASYGARAEYGTSRALGGFSVTVRFPAGWRSAEA